MIDRLLNVPATLITPSDPLDDVDQTPGTPTETATVCYLEQTDAAEDDSGAVQWSRYDVYLPAALEPTGEDQVRVGGVTYTFEGDPAEALNARTGARSHWTGKLRRAER